MDRKAAGEDALRHRKHILLLREACCRLVFACHGPCGGESPKPNGWRWILARVYHELARSGTFCANVKTRTRVTISDSALSQRALSIGWKLINEILPAVLRSSAVASDWQSGGELALPRNPSLQWVILVVAAHSCGAAWQIHLLTLPRARFLLMSATLGESSFFSKQLTALTGAPTTLVQSDPRPVSLEFEYSTTQLQEKVAEHNEQGRSPVYLVHFTQNACADTARDLLNVVCGSNDTIHFSFPKSSPPPIQP